MPDPSDPSTVAALPSLYQEPIAPCGVSYGITHGLTPRRSEQRRRRRNTWQVFRRHKCASQFPNAGNNVPTSPPLPGIGINAFNYGLGDIDGGSLTALAGNGIKALCSPNRSDQIFAIRSSVRARLNASSIIVLDPSHRSSGPSAVD
jgi:hypothetical protein